MDVSDHEVSYVAGTWVALCGADTWLLLDLPPNNSLVMTLWPLVRAGTPVDDLLDALTAEGIRATPSFAIIRLAGDERRAIVRGAGSVHLVSEDGDSSFTALPGGTWADNLLPGAAVEISLASSSFTGDLTQLPMAIGVTSAAVVLISEHRHAESASVAVMQIPEPVESIVPAAPVEPPVQAAVARPESIILVARTATVEPVALVEVVPEPTVEAGPEPAAEPELAVEPESTDANAYDSLFGQTINPQQVAKEWSAPAEPVFVNPGLVDAVPDLVVVPNTFATQDWSPVDEGAESGGLIDAVPWLTDAPAAQVAAPMAPEMRAVLAQAPALKSVGIIEEQDVRTVSRAQLLAEAAAAAGPHVLAVYCPQRHLTPPHSATCRVCGAAVAEQAAFSIDRPALGVLRLPTGDEVILDRGVIFGRAPESHATEDRPHLVRLTTPENEISRSHGEIVIDGWNVLIRDLGSTNGTTVALPGQAPLRLRGHDLFALEPKSVICLADQLSITFEVTA
jgi:hypothetical protein